jgi:FAD/FMN-containing dehydrogenase
MGVDLILGAKLVNHEGRVVEADERMLQAIRGGGGTLGVIVEMRIKVFPLDKV